jgi:DNA-binding NarL/FixJ family response regulator
VKRPRALIVELTAEEKRHLERMLKTQTLPVRDFLRAKMILLASDGVSNAEIARRLEIHEHTVRKWRKRFLKDRLKGLRDLPRAGAPSAFSP